MLKMRFIALFPLICILFIACCEGSEQQAKFKIPFPDSKNEVDTSIANLLNRTGLDLEQSIEDPKKWLRHGSALYANSYYAEASIAFHRAISIKVDMPQATYLLASSYWKVNSQTKAIQTLKQALDLMPQYDIGWRLLAQWHQNRGEIKLAQAAARQAFAINPNRVGTRHVLAQSLMDDGKYLEAIPLLEEVIKLDRTPRWIYSLAFQCYRQQGMNEKAKECEAFAGPPPLDWPDPMFQHIPDFIAGKAALAEYAMHLYKTSGPVKAKPYLVKALKINPEHLNVRVGLSIALQEEGRLKEAKQLLIDFKGQPNVNYWKQFASISISFGEFEDARGFIKNALNVDIQDGNAHDIAALIADELGSAYEACSYWESAGELHLEQNSFDKAQASFENAEKHCPPNIKVLESLAFAYFKNNNLNLAQQAIHKLLDLDPANENAIDLSSRIRRE